MSFFSVLSSPVRWPIKSKLSIVWALCWVFIFCALPSSVYAFETVKDNKGRVLRWKVPTLVVYLNPNGASGISASEVIAAFQKAAKSWNSVKCSKLQFFIRSAGIFPNRKDKKNSASFPPNFSGTHLLQTSYSMDSNGYFLDIDISLNPQGQWTSGTSGTGQDMESGAMVALGHIAGLASSTVQGATMFNSFSSGDISKRTLHPDDIAGICTLYPSGQPQCAVDSDCPPGLGCQNAKCIAKAPQTLPSTCKACQTNQECGSNQLVCDLVGNGRFCIHRCTPDGLCPQGFSCSGTGSGAQCLPVSGICSKSCKTNQDCGAGLKCTAGKCVAECTRDTDCKPTYRCRSGRCFAPGVCNTTVDCPAGKICKAKRCIDQSSSLPCTVDNDCPHGQSCVNKFCKKTAPTCVDGEKRGCACSGGSKGQQVCSGNSWGACQGCGTPQTCAPNSTQACTCSDGKNGSQTCAADGTAWGACVCSGGPLCSPNSTQACACAGGQKGVQTCSADGKSWGTCTQCSSTKPKVCAPGGTQACVCTNGSKGAQICSADGTTWEACKCTGNGNLCTPNSTQACVCTNGKNGTQTCAVDGKLWGTCQGCGGTNPGKVCAPGATQACVCTNGKSGSQSCMATGQGWAACQCAGTQPPPTDGGTTTPTACTTHNECPAGSFCIQNICKASSNNTGCSCSIESTSRHSWPIVFLGLFLLVWNLRRRHT